MGKRARQRARDARREPAGSQKQPGGPTSEPTRAPKSPLEGLDEPLPVSVFTDAEGNQLELRGSLTPKARAEYASTLAGGLNQEDAWQRATELLFERLVASWTISGLRLDRQRELLGRYRMASTDERRFIRDSLRAHLHENFPELQAP